MRLIDADALLDKIHNVDGMEVFENSNIFAMHYERMVKSMPTIEDRKTDKWNVITKRPMDEEERKVWEVEMGEIADEDAYIYENLPEEGEEVLVCTQFGRVFIDTMCIDEGCYFEEYGEMEGIVAWRPLPEPYKEVDE